SLENSIYHKWEWIQSEGGIGGVVQDPGSEGYTQAIRFEEEGRYTRFRDGAVLHRGNFSLLGSKSLLDGKVYQMISFDDGSPSHAIISVLGDRLTLREECFDCFTHDYRR
ncbi:MAG: hypothetical protein GY940_42380, partial [bacterium]|nr:hypothetical protein [bacterium]